MNEATSAANLHTSRVEALVQKLIAKTVQVEVVEAPNVKFRLLTLQGDALKGVQWTPGSYIDLLPGGWAHPSYTPLEFDSEAGRTRLAVYLHASGPGARWASTVRVGDACRIHGPRAGLDLGKLARPAVFFGDETTFGLAAALRATARGPVGVDFLFELNTRSESAEALEMLALPGSSSCVRRGDDRHLPELEAKMLELVRSRQPVQFLLSGRAAAIQRLMNVLRKVGFARSQFLVQAYWRSRE